MNLLNKKVQISIWEFQKPRGVSQFVKNVWFENSPQIPSKMSKINLLYFFSYFLMQICLFYVYLMKSGLILTFLIEIYANMQFYMLFSYSKMSEFDPFGGGSAIFKNVWSSKKVWIIWGAKPNWEFFLNFFVF